MTLITDSRRLPDIDPTRLTAEDRDGLALADYFRNLTPTVHDVVTMPVVPLARRIPDVLNIVHGRFTLTTRGLCSYATDITPQEVLEAAMSVDAAKDAFNFALADLLYLGKDSAEIFQMLDESDLYDYNGNQNRMRVPAVFEYEARVWPLTFWQYHEMTPDWIPQEARVKMMNEAARMGKGNGATGYLRQAKRQLFSELYPARAAIRALKFDTKNPQRAAAWLQEKMPKQLLWELYEEIGALLNGDE